MATVYRRPGSRYWMAQVWNRYGKRQARSTACTKRRDAQKVAEDWESDERDAKRRLTDVPTALSHLLEMGLREAASGHLTLARFEELLRRGYSVAHPEHRDVTVGDWLAEWTESQRQYVTEGTMNTYHGAMGRLRAAFGHRTLNKPLTSLTPDDCGRALAKMHESVVAASANLSLKLLRRACEAAVVAKLVPTNAAKLVRPLPTVDSVKRTCFSVREVRTLIDACATHAPFVRAGTVDEWQGLILLGSHTALRRGDLLRLSSDHLNADRTEVHLLPKKTAKSGDVLRIPLSPAAIRWIGTREGLFFPRLAKLGGECSHAFTRLMVAAGVAREVKVAGDQVARRTLHSLRHSFISWMAEADIHADVRRRLTGHKSSVVHDQYTHADEALKRAVACLPTP